MDPPRTGAAKRARWLPWVLLVGLFGLVAVLYVAGSPQTLSHADGHRVIRVTGRIVSGVDGEPIEGARVMTVSSYHLKRDWYAEEEWRDVEAVAREQEREQRGGRKPDLWADTYTWLSGGMRSTPEGTIDVYVALWMWENTSGFRTWGKTQKPESKVAALWVAVEGRAPVFVETTEAKWREEPDRTPTGLWGTYDLGTVVVPVGEPDER